MEFSNVNAVKFNLNKNKVLFKSEHYNATSDPIQEKEMVQQEEFASKEGALATRATGMAQLLMGNGIRLNMTQRNYVNNLIKQGKIPNKHFYVKNQNNGSLPIVTEVNSKGERIKEVLFYKDGNIGCSFYNPNTQERYKALETSEGKLHISNNNSLTGEPLSDEVYRRDGSLEDTAFYKKTPEGQISANGDYVISSLDGSSN